MISRVKEWLFWALAGIAAWLGVRGVIFKNQRDSARSRAREEEARAEGERLARDAERRITEAQAEARKSNKEARRERENDPDRLAGRIDLHDRLRD